MAKFHTLPQMVMAAYDAGKSDSSVGLKRLADAGAGYDGYCGHALTEFGRAEAEQLRPLRDAGKALVGAAPIERNPARQDLNRAFNDYYQVSRRTQEIG